MSSGSSTDRRYSPTRLAVHRPDNLVVVLPRVCCGNLCGQLHKPVIIQLSSPESRADAVEYGVCSIPRRDPKHGTRGGRNNSKPEENCSSTLHDATWRARYAPTAFLNSSGSSFSHCRFCLLVMNMITHLGSNVEVYKADFQTRLASGMIHHKPMHLCPSVEPDFVLRTSGVNSSSFLAGFPRLQRRSISLARHPSGAVVRAHPSMLMTMSACLTSTQAPSPRSSTSTTAIRDSCHASAVQVTQYVCQRALVA